MTALQARGLWGREVKIPREIELPPVWSGEDHKEAKRRRDGAMRIWNACRNPEGTPVERYLEGRCLELPDCADLKYHPSLKHRDGGKWPAMVCLIRDPISRKPLGIHRTFLTGDGRKAPVSAAKVMLGSCQGGVLALAEPRDQLLVAEGIENALSGQQVVKLPAWAALSAGNMSAIRLPGTLARVTILADRDDSGRAAAHDACRVWRAAYRALDARIAWPEPEYGDFNDQLVAEKMKEADHVSH